MRDKRPPRQQGANTLCHASCALWLLSSPEHCSTHRYVHAIHVQQLLYGEGSATACKCNASQGASMGPPPPLQHACMHAASTG